MGISNMNFKSYGIDPPGDGGGGSGRPPGGNYPLIRQSSVYSLTFDEFQNTLGGLGKDFGSMNMDELLKNIWSAEETQSMSIAAVGSSGQDVGIEGGYLQRQGSLTLPRTLSQKTVDEVWKDIAREFGGESEKDVPTASQPTNRQQTLGEMTLEEFLVRAGVVREEPTKPNPNPGGIFGDLARDSNGNNGAGGDFGISFQQPGGGIELMSNRISDNNNSNNNNNHSNNFPLIVNGVRNSQQQQPNPSRVPQQQHQALLFPKQTNVSYALTGGSAQLGMRGGIVGLNDQGGGMGMVGLPARSPALSSDGLAKSNGDSSSVSPVPYVFNGGLRGRKSHNTVDKVVERRQRRMIKNRESAARSRARKQAYTVELEQEVAKLKEENQELRRKQTKIMEVQKNQVNLEQVMEMIEETGPRKKLRRTLTGPW